MSWTHYLAWDDYQASFIRRCVGKNARISVVGSVWFNSSLRSSRTREHAR